MQALKYLAGYPEQIAGRVNRLIAEDRLGKYLSVKYPSRHDIRTEKALYDFTVAIKN